MRLQEYSLHSYRLRYDQPVQWSDIVEEAAPFVLLRLVSDTGAVGVAEITVKPTWCGVTARSLATTIVEVFIPLLRDAELDDPIKVRQLLDRIPENQASKTLIDNACWDLAAAHAGSPLWRLWGGAGRVDLSWAVTRQAPQAMAAEAAAMVSRHGFRTLKIKVGQGFDQDCAALREIRASVGDGVRLYVDANGAYSVEQAADYAKAMADGGAVVIEDPCPLSPDARFQSLQRDSQARLLVDFGCASLRDAALFIERGAKALSIKPGRFGLSNARAMHGLAVGGGCASVVGLMGESVLGTLAGLQFAATISQSLLPAELTWFLAMNEQITTMTPNIIDGAIELPDYAGLAGLVDWSAVQRFAV